MVSKLEQLSYDVNYTASTYLDAMLTLMCKPAIYVGQATKRFAGKNTPSFLDPDTMVAKSQLYLLRDNIRRRMDTQPGVLYLQSNVVGLVPFVLAGMPAAEAAQSGIEHVVENMSPIAKCITNSVVTFGCQMATGYTAFFGNEVRTNLQKYVRDGAEVEWKNVSSKKVTKAVMTTFKTFWKFDIAFMAIKTGLQTLYLLNGKDPWEASAIADAIGIPTWYAVAIPLGLHSGIIETEKSKDIFPNNTN